MGHKIPAKRLLTFKRDEDLTFMVKYDGELPPTVPVTIAKYNITGVKKAMVCLACCVYGHASVRCVCTRGRARNTLRAERYPTQAHTLKNTLKTLKHAVMRRMDHRPSTPTAQSPRSTCPSVLPARGSWRSTKPRPLLRRWSRSRCARPSSQRRRTPPTPTPLRCGECSHAH